MQTLNHRDGFSLLEVMLATVVVAVLCVAVMRHARQPGERVKSHACQLTAAELQIQVQRFQADYQQLPSASLAELSADSYVGHALSVCPVDGRPYALDRSTGSIIPHTH